MAPAFASEWRDRLTTNPARSRNEDRSEPSECRDSASAPNSTSARPSALDLRGAGVPDADRDRHDTRDPMGYNRPDCNTRSFWFRLVAIRQALRTLHIRKGLGAA